MLDELFPVSTPSLLDFESEAWLQGYTAVCGIDEAGRGPLAGPVVACALILPNQPNITVEDLPSEVNDSKKLSAKKRAKLLDIIQNIPDIAIGVGVCTAQEVDQHNILNATHLAMKRAYENLPQRSDFCLVDGLPVKGLAVDHQGIVKGDSRSYSIAAASIVAKETRDAMMIDYAKQFPEYSFEKHKGYGTKAHNEALQKHGPCEIHRYSFAPVRLAAEKFNNKHNDNKESDYGLL